MTSKSAPTYEIDSSAKLEASDLRPGNVLPLRLRPDLTTNGKTAIEATVLIVMVQNIGDDRRSVLVCPEGGDFTQEGFTLTVEEDGALSVAMGPDTAGYFPGWTTQDETKLADLLTSNSGGN